MLELVVIVVIVPVLVNTGNVFRKGEVGVIHRSTTTAIRSVTRLENRDTSRVTKDARLVGRLAQDVEREAIGLIAAGRKKKQETLLERNMSVKFSVKTAM